MRWSSHRYRVIRKCTCVERGVEKAGRHRGSGSGCLGSQGPGLHFSSALTNQEPLYKALHLLTDHFCTGFLWGGLACWELSEEQAAEKRPAPGASTTTYYHGPWAKKSQRLEAGSSPGSGAAPAPTALSLRAHMRALLVKTQERLGQGRLFWPRKPPCFGAC